MLKLAWKVFEQKLLLMVELEMTVVGSRIFALLVAISFLPLWSCYSNLWSLDQRVRFTGGLLEMLSLRPYHGPVESQSVF